MLGHRANDAVLTICQNNGAKSIEIIDVNDALAGMVGYGAKELSGKNLSEMVPDRLSELLSEYVEYEDDANDVGMVLSKVQNFGLKAKSGQEKKFRLKVVRGESTRDRLTFRLVLQDTTDAKKDDALRNLIQENFKGHEVLHPEIGVPDRKSLEKDIELVVYYHHKAELRASFVLIRPDHIHDIDDQYGSRQRVLLMKHIVHVCRGNLRPGDVVGALDSHTLGVLLLDATGDSTRMVANRLRWQIAAQPFGLPDRGDLSLTASMSYSNIDGVKAAPELIAACEAMIAPEQTGLLVEAK